MLDLKLALELSQCLTNLQTAYTEWKMQKSKRPPTPPPQRNHHTLPRINKPQRPLPMPHRIVYPSSLLKPRDKHKSKRLRGKDKLSGRTRRKLGYYTAKFLEMEIDDGEELFTNTRMDKDTFQLLLSICENSLEKHSIRTSECPKSRLALTLLYLSQGHSLQTLAGDWKLGKETVRSIVLETCSVLWKELNHIHVSEPGPEAMRAIAVNFWNMWQVPNCVGAIDGKHIAITVPPQVANSETAKVNSLVLLAACDANYKFTFVDVDAYGAPSLGGIFHTSCLGKRLIQGEIRMPEQGNLPNSRISLDHFFVANVAFPLHPHIMKPYPSLGLTDERLQFNRRIAMAKGIIDNAFGVLVTRWKILQTNIHMLPSNAEKVVLACVALHNFLCSNPLSKRKYIPPKFVDWKDAQGTLLRGKWRSETPNELTGITPSRNGHSFQRNRSVAMRNELCAYLKNNP